MFNENPHLIQERPSGCPWVKIAPLVLIHDGGGTTFSYYCLGNLKRDVYGISNPYYSTNKVWRGGIPEMARTYVRYIKSVIPRGEIILGGWSLGGLISLEVTRILAEDPALRIIGMIMVDSICPLLLSPSSIRLAQHVAGMFTVYSGPAPESEFEFEFNHRMVGEWTMPTWGDEAPVKDSSETESDSSDTFPKRNSLRPSSVRVYTPPPVILLRAAKAVPVLEEGVSRVDVHRTKELLGWDQYRKDLITKVIELPDVHHYDIFVSEEALARATAKINEACLDIESSASVFQ
ncbi:hypothetical protein OQA88_13640 [Cercophora sp. LCS_1]